LVGSTADEIGTAPFMNSGGQSTVPLPNAWSDSLGESIPFKRGPGTTLAWAVRWTGPSEAVPRVVIERDASGVVEGRTKYCCRGNRDISGSV